MYFWCENVSLIFPKQIYWKLKLYQPILMAGQQKSWRLSSRSLSLIVIGFLFFLVGLLSIEILTSIPDSSALPIDTLCGNNAVSVTPVHKIQTNLDQSKHNNVNNNNDQLAI